MEMMIIWDFYLLLQIYLFKPKLNNMKFIDTGMLLDLSEKNFGQRFKRAVFYIDDNVVKYFKVDEQGFKDTSAESLFENI
jgi:peroxiredoxin